MQHAPQLPPRIRSPRKPQRSDALAFWPGRPIVMDVRVAQPLTGSAGAVVAWAKRETAEDALKRNKYSSTGCSVPLSDKMYGHTGPQAKQTSSKWTARKFYHGIRVPSR